MPHTFQSQKKMDDRSPKLVWGIAPGILTHFPKSLGSLSIGGDEVTELAGFVAVVSVANCTYTTKYRIAYLVVLVKLGMRLGDAISVSCEVLAELRERGAERLTDSSKETAHPVGWASGRRCYLRRGVQLRAIALWLSVRLGGLDYRLSFASSSCLGISPGITGPLGSYFWGPRSSTVWR